LAAILVIASALALGAPAAASAWWYTDIIDFNLTESVVTYGYYSISQDGDGSANYRWLDDPDHSTVISGNNCSDLSPFGVASISAHNTSYHQLFSGGWWGLCFALRGRVAYGAGSMYNHDGRLQR
jgi:hypothetical protein